MPFLVFLVAAAFSSEEARTPGRTPTAAATATPAPGSCASGPHASARREFLERVNAMRRQERLAPLRLSDPLCRAAQRRADGIAESGEEMLESLGGEDVFALVALEAYDARYAGELLVQASGTPREIVAGWRRDIGAGEAFGRPEARDMGMGMAEIEGTPLYAFLFALDAREDFLNRTAGLSSREEVLGKMLELVNAQRRKHLKSSGRAASSLDLKRNALLDRAAQAHADDMLARSFYGHEDPEGADAWRRARLAGYRAWMVGENVAQGQGSLEEVMEGWMASPEHRKNILNLAYTEAGFGLAVGKNAQGYQVLWVQVFGRPR